MCLTASRGGAPIQLLLALSFVESAVDYPLGFEPIASTVRHRDKSLRSTMSEITFKPDRLKEILKSAVVGQQRDKREQFSPIKLFTSNFNEK